MDACGASSSLSTPEKYDVFLSFRGEDTRDKFTSHLYAALDRKKIKAYIDELSLERGDEISPALLEAIKKSKISIIVFSKDYASSSWCLSELVRILECHRENKKMVIPIFYEVDPSHIRKQEGSYGEAFLKHQERFKDRMEIVQKWRVALTESASLSGWDSRVIRPESKLVEAIVEDVLRKLNRWPSSNFGFEDLIGIDKKIEEIKSLLCVCSPKVLIVGIWGMGGIGKTTLAQVIFHLLSSQFEAFCFVPNVREEAEKGSLINLRNKLLAELLKEENVNVGTSTLGPTFLKERLQRTKVLIVLDDVNHVEQVNTFIGGRDQFSCESRIVITTRDASVLRDISVDGMYEVKQLDFNKALQLFNLIAFRGNSAVKDYIKLSENVVERAGGIPLAVTVLGSHFRSLSSQSKEAWEAALDKLKAVPPNDIHNVLRISFDGLDETEKDIFLDIACFFKGMSRDCVENILNACDFFASTGIDALIDKSLIAIKGNVLWMHDLLEEMGKKIVCQESAELGERSRLWVAKDAREVLENNEGTKKIQGIFLDLSKIDEEIHLEPTIFKKMHNLRVLAVSDYSYNNKCKVYLEQGLEYLPLSLRYLKWHKYPLKYLPCNFKPKNLVELYMPYSQLEELWDGVQDVNKLRTIDLRQSIHLIQISDLSRARNLERINLEHCTSLHQVPSHILQNLNKISDVNMSYCSKLQSLPDRIDGASLRTLSLQGCSNINTLPMIITGSLMSLNLSSTAIESLPSSVGSLKNLCELYLNDCKRLTSLPCGIIKLDSLKTLELRRCSNLEKFPALPWNIVRLDIMATAIKEVESSSIDGRFGLRSINMSNCKSLESLPTNISRLRSLAYLHLGGCSKLKSFPEILEPMESLKNLHLTGTGIRWLPSSIGNLIGLTDLSLDECEKLESIPSGISTFGRLSQFRFSNCPKLDYIQLSFNFLPSVLEDLDLSNSNIKEIPQSIFEGNFRLRSLLIRNCKNLRSLPDRPFSLKILDARGCESLEEVLNSRRALTPEFWTGNHMIDMIVIRVECFIFCDCLKLNNKARDNIIIDFQLRVFRMTTIKGFRNIVGACFPGNEIPKWFKHQREGSSINIKLPREWNNSNFLGFVVCAVGDSYSDTELGLDLICELNLKPNQGEIQRFTLNFTNMLKEYEILPSTSNSSHLYMWYQRQYHHQFLDAEEASFCLYFRRVFSKRQVKKCGIHMLYCQDLEEFGFHFIKNERHLGINFRCNPPTILNPLVLVEPMTLDTEEPHPKTIKFSKFL